MKNLNYAFNNSILFIALICTVVFFTSCGIQPSAWQPPVKPEFSGNLSLNDKLKDVDKMDLGEWNGPEDFVFDDLGNMYTGVHKGADGFSEGAILRITPEGKVEEYLRTDSWITGIKFDVNGDIIALKNGVGLIKIDKNKKVEILVDKAPDGGPILMGSGLTIGKNGKIYFANLSSNFITTKKNINKLFLEIKPTGGVYCYDPKTKLTNTISNGNYFANGLALSEDESFLLVSETSKYRILKYWLKGNKTGQSEVLIDNLAGFPNNIFRRDNGNFWIGFTTKRNDQLDGIHPKKGLKKMVYGLPSFLQPKAEKFGMIMEISEEGKLIQALFDSKGESVIEAGAIIEHDNKLYIGGDVVSYISKYNID